MRSPASSRSSRPIQRVGGLRLLPGRFMAINQAMGTPRGRDNGCTLPRCFVDEMKASGFVAEAFARNRIERRRRWRPDGRGCSIGARV